MTSLMFNLESFLGLLFELGDFLGVDAEVSDNLDLQCLMFCVTSSFVIYGAQIEIEIFVNVFHRSLIRFFKRTTLLLCKLWYNFGATRNDSNPIVNEKTGENLKKQTTKVDVR